jgi:hypothetical protein
MGFDCGFPLTLAVRGSGDGEEHVRKEKASKRARACGWKGEAPCDGVLRHGRSAVRSTERLSMPRLLQGHGNVGTAVVWHASQTSLRSGACLGPGLTPHAQKVKVLRQKNPYGVVVRVSGHVRADVLRWMRDV